MKNKINLIILLIVIISSLFILTGCTSTAQEESMFVRVSMETYFDVYYHKETKVMYAVSDGYNNYGTVTVLLDAEGKPLLYEGE